MEEESIAIFCVGNKLMLDEGIGPAVYDELVGSYEFPDNVDIFDVGCMGLDMLNMVNEYDYMITVDALDNTKEPAGTIFEFAPEDMARHNGASASLHELKLVDLFDAAGLLGFSCEGKCFGMQVENMTPETVTIGLTPAVFEKLPYLVDTVLAELVSRGIEVHPKGTDGKIAPGWHHRMLPSQTGL